MRCNECFNTVFFQPTFVGRLKSLLFREKTNDWNNWDDFRCLSWCCLYFIKLFYWNEMKWLDVPERVTLKLGLMTYSCLHGQAPRYLADHIKPAIEVASRHRLRSANRHRLIVPRCRLNAYGRRAFPVAGPTVWNSLPDELRDPACDIDSFKQFFKTILFSQY